jgi:hypothetical protein
VAAARRARGYAEEAAFYHSGLAAACDGKLESLLEVGSGGGNNASQMKQHASLTLVDRAPGMLAVAGGFVAERLPFVHSALPDRELDVFSARRPAP